MASQDAALGLPKELSIENIIAMKKPAAEDLLKKLDIAVTPGISLHTAQTKLLKHRDTLRDSALLAKVSHLDNSMTAVLQRLACLETASGEESGKALQDRLAALERGVPVPQAAAKVHSTPTANSAIDFESVVQETQLRDARKTQLCISNLAFPEEKSDDLQVLVEEFFQTEMHMDTADSQVSAVKRMRGKDDRPGILIVTCHSVQQRNQILQAAKQLRGRPIYIHPNWTKLQAQEQFRLRQLRREAIARGEKAYFRSGQLVILTEQKATPPTAHSTSPPTFLAAAAATPAAAPSQQ